MSVLFFLSLVGIVTYLIFLTFLGAHIKEVTLTALKSSLMVPLLAQPLRRQLQRTKRDCRLMLAIPILSELKGSDPLYFNLLT